MSLRDASENEHLDFLFNEGTTVTNATHLLVATNSPGDAGSVTEIQTPGSNGYARQALTPAEWNAAASGSKSNSANIDFGPATADWATGSTQASTVLATDASTGGTPIFVFTIGTPVNVLNTQTLRFAGGTPGDLVASFD